MEKVKSQKKRKIVKIVFSTLFLLFTFIVVFPLLFPEYVTKKVKYFANQNLEGEISFKEANLTFFSHFPSLTLNLEDFLLKGSKPFDKDTLVAAKQIDFGINLKDLIFSGEVNIDEIYVENGDIQVKVNKKGEANYNVYKSENATVNKDTSSTKITLSRIDIENTSFTYDDKSTKILVNAKGFNYLGKGDLDKAIFDLYTEATIKSFDFTYNNETYLKNKSVNADLITKINTNSLSFIFEENNLKINKLPVDFIGKLDFLKNGYNLDFSIESVNSNLYDFFTAFPPQFTTWLSKTQIKGKTDVYFALKGKYIEEQNIKPNVTFSMNVRDGFISHNKSNVPLEQLQFKFKTSLPSLNTKELTLAIDTLQFKMGADYFKGKVYTKGVENPKVEAKIKAKINLEQLNKTIAFTENIIKGKLGINLFANGVYLQDKNQFPKANGFVSLQSGYIKTNYYPNAITNINCLAKINAPTGDFKDLTVELTPASFSFEEKPFFIKASLKNLNDIAYDIRANGILDIGKIYKVFKIEGYNVNGFAKMNLNLKGTQSDAINKNYSKLQNSGTLNLKNIYATATSLPLPLQIVEGDFLFNQDKMNFSNFKANYGKSSFSMNGYLENVINFVLTKNAILKGKFSLTSDEIFLNEFIPKNDNSDSIIAKKENTTKTTPQGSVAQVPKNFELLFKLNANKVQYEDLIIKDVNGNVSIKEGTLQLQNGFLTIIDCKAKMNVTYKPENDVKASFAYDILANNFDIKRAYNEIAIFRELATTAKDAEGIVSLDYKITGKLNNEMSPIMPSIKGGGKLEVKQVKMKGFKLFNVISKKTETDALMNPDLSKITIKSSIKNNIITIERFKFRVAGFRPRIEGQTSLDGKLNLKMRLGLPPLGIIGIPIKVTGTQDNPKVSLGRKTEDLQETEYDDSESTTP